MPSPKPLTLCEAPKLDWSRPGAPAAKDFDDIYFSVEGGLEECKTVFLAGCGLPQGWQDKPVYTIGELGFGTGLNFLTTWQMWDKTKQAADRLHFVSFEKYPFDAAQLKQALQAWPELKLYADQLISAWPGRVKGFHRLHFGNVTLTLIHDDIEAGLDGLKASVNAWFLDGFSPAKNPGMWSAKNIKQLASKSSPGAKVATFTVAGSVRQALSEAGFLVEKKPGFGRKRERLEAFLPGTMPDVRTIPAPTILGAGIGGASLALAFKRRGITPKIISRGLEKAASGNPAAIIKPRLDLQDRPESRFYLSAFLYDQELYEAAGAVIHRGIRHTPKDDSELRRYQKLLNQAPLPHGHLGIDQGDLIYQSGLIVDPKIMRDYVLSGCDILKRDIESLDEIVSDGPVILSPGFGVKALLPDLGLRFSRGQLTWAKGSVPEPLTYGGYAIPLAEDILVGTTHDRLGPESPFQLRPKDDEKNLSGYMTKTGQTLSQSKRPSRASVRVNTIDTIPRVLSLQDKIWLLTGLGSRGFVFAPLLAEAIVSEILGEPSPIERKMWARLSS